MNELMHTFIGRPPGQPDVGPARPGDFIQDNFAAGAPELKMAFFACNIILRALTLLMKRKPFSRLSEEERQILVNGLLESRHPLLRGIVFILGLPVLMSYYRRPEVAVPLGFDSRALKEEAGLRAVSRDRDLPPREGGPT
jgi:hypothetical protein